MTDTPLDPVIHAQARLRVVAALSTSPRTRRDRLSVELVWAAVGDYRPDPTAMLMLLAWTVPMAALAVWSFRRDEGRWFR